MDSGFWIASRYRAVQNDGCPLSRSAVIPDKSVGADAIQNPFNNGLFRATGEVQNEDARLD